MRKNNAKNNPKKKRVIFDIPAATSQAHISRDELSASERTAYWFKGPELQMSLRLEVQSNVQQDRHQAKKYGSSTKHPQHWRGLEDMLTKRDKTKHCKKFVKQVLQAQTKLKSQRGIDPDKKQEVLMHFCRELTTQDRKRAHDLGLQDALRAIY